MLPRPDVSRQAQVAVALIGIQVKGCPTSSRSQSVPVRSLKRSRGRRPDGTVNTAERNRIAHNDRPDAPIYPRITGICSISIEADRAEPLHNMRSVTLSSPRPAHNSAAQAEHPIIPRAPRVDLDTLPAVGDEMDFHRRYSRGIELWREIRFSPMAPKHPPRRVVERWSGFMYQPCTSITVNNGEQRGLTVNEKPAVSRGETRLPGPLRSTGRGLIT